MSGTKAKSDGGLWPMVRLGLVLAAYAVAACTVLAAVNNVTSPIIKENQERKANEAMKAVFPLADSFEEPDAICATSASGTTRIESVRLAVAGGKVAGAVAQVSGPTYERSTIMVGLSLDGIITGMRYLENTDTPGFGQKGSDPTFTLASGKTFYGQFEGLRASEGFVAGKTFDAISGATITTNGIATLVSDAAKCLSELLEEYR